MDDAVAWSGYRVTVTWGHGRRCMVLKGPDYLFITTETWWSRERTIMRCSSFLHSDIVLVDSPLHCNSEGSNTGSRNKFDALRGEWYRPLMSHFLVDCFCKCSLVFGYFGWFVITALNHCNNIRLTRGFRDWSKRIADSFFDYGFHIFLVWVTVEEWF